MENKAQLWKAIKALNCPRFNGLRILWNFANIYSCFRDTMTQMIKRDENQEEIRISCCIYASEASDSYIQVPPLLSDCKISETPKV